VLAGAPPILPGVSVAAGASRAAATRAASQASASAAERVLGPIAGGGAKLENLSFGDISRIQNAANRTGTPVTLVGSRANGTARSLSDYDYLLPQGTRGSVRSSLKSSLPEGYRGIGDPRNQDFFFDALDPTKPFILFRPQ